MTINVEKLLLAVRKHLIHKQDVPLHPRTLEAFQEVRCQVLEDMRLPVRERILESFKKEYPGIRNRGKF